MKTIYRVLLILLRFLEIRIYIYGSFKAPEEASKLSYLKCSLFYIYT